MNRLTPLPHEWMLAGIIGLLISVLYIYDQSKTWGFTLALFFGVILVASLVSMHGSSVAEEDLVELAVHHPKVRRGDHRK